MSRETNCDIVSPGIGLASKTTWLVVNEKWWNEPEMDDSRVLASINRESEPESAIRLSQKALPPPRQ